MFANVLNNIFGGSGLELLSMLDGPAVGEGVAVFSNGGDAAEMHFTPPIMESVPPLLTIHPNLGNARRVDLWSNVRGFNVFETYVGNAAYRASHVELNVFINCLLLR